VLRAYGSGKTRRRDNARYCSAPLGGRPWGTQQLLSFDTHGVSDLPAHLFAPTSAGATQENLRYVYGLIGRAAQFLPGRCKHRCFVVAGRERHPGPSVTFTDATTANRASQLPSPLQAASSVLQSHSELVPGNNSLALRVEVTSTVAAEERGGSPTEALPLATSRGSSRTSKPPQVFDPADAAAMPQWYSTK